MRFQTERFFYRTGKSFHAICSLFHPTEEIMRAKGVGVVPLDFKIRRILLPVARKKNVSKFRPSRLCISYFVVFPEFHTSNNLDLGNAVGVTKDNTDLGRSGTLLGQLADVVNNLVGGGLEPRRRSARVGERGGGNALALAVKTTHFDLVMCPEEIWSVVGVDERSKFEEFGVWTGKMGPVCGVT
jgi:hypothetical protein